MEITDYLQKPTLIQSIDVSHIISKHFGSLFSTDCVEPEIINNLTVSRGSTDQSHQNYVTQLIKVTEEREELFMSTQRLREHIYAARNKALIDDLQIEEENKEFSYLNLPPNESTFNKYIDNDLLRENGLIAPEDVILSLNLKENGDKVDSSAGVLFSDKSINKGKSAKKNKGQSSTKMTEYRLPPIERPVSTERNKKINDIKKHKSPDMILAVEREEDKHMLEMMAMKNNYLRNPRHNVPGNKNHSKDWLVKVNSNEEYPKMFIPIPDTVEFSDYETGKVYEKVINFRNVTSVLRTIRVLPPKSRYFSLSLGQFPGEKGLVAAGMSCQYAIKFSPDSLGDFEDEVTVETQGGNTFSVKLISRRPRPLLSGGQVWDMGYSLVYGLKIVHYTIKNNGGHGKFCLIDSSLWPVSNSKSSITNKQIILEPFMIRPSFFELRTNESITLDLLFCPITLGAVSREFNILCDNCHMETFTIKGEGEMASIITESVEDGVSTADIGESTDISAQMLIKFGDLNPFTYCQKIIILKNESHTEVPYCWKIIKPNLKVASFETEDLSTNVVQNRTLDFDSAFLIEPPFGVFESNDSIAFTITFAPLEVKDNHSVLHLVLQGIPDIKIEPMSGSELQNEGFQKQKFQNSMSEDFLAESPACAQLPNTQIKTICLNDVTSLEIEVKGACIPLEVTLNPPAIIISGDLLIDTSVRRKLQICNQSMCPININWTNSDSVSHIFTVEPQLGMIEPGEVGVVDVCIVSSVPGFVRDTLVCTVDNLDRPLQLVVEAKFKGPEIEIDENNIDFGLVKINDVVHRTLHIINRSSIKCNWRSRIGGSEDLELFECLKVSPSGGVLAPLQSERILVTLVSEKNKNIDCGLEIALEHGSTKYLNVLACIQSPQVVLEKSGLDVSGRLFVNVPSTFEVKLLNQSHLISRFNWQAHMGPQSDNVSIFVEPFQGTIQPNKETIIKITITCYIQDIIENLILPCVIDDMNEPVLLRISGIIQGPRITCKVLKSIEDTNLEEEKDLELNFDKDVEVFKDVKKYILIENTTSIVTQFCLSVDYFKAFSEKVEISKDRTKIPPNLADRQSKPDKLAHYDFCKEMLAHKLGLAVGFNPTRGTLAGYEQLVIEVIVYNDMWGEYNDLIRITGNAQTLEVEPITIPMSISVKGVPIEFTMTSGRKEQKPILRLGSKPLGHETISRKVRLNNKSPCDIYINWEMYSDVMESEDKLIDVIITCGDPFPIPKSCNESQYLDSTRYNDSVASTSTRQITDREQIEESDVKVSDDFISLIIRPNEGKLTTKPISFDPQQLMIPSESYGFVTIIFDPRNLGPEEEINWDNNNGISYSYFLLGFVSLQEKDLKRGSFLARNHQYAVEQIKLDITGRILRPSLQIEYADDEEEVRYKVPFSVLLNTKSVHSLLKSMSFTNFVTLRNLKDTEVSFSLKTRPPFEITNPKLTSKSTLGIGEMVKVGIKFTIDKNQLSVLNDRSMIGNDESKCLRVEKLSIQECPRRTLKNAIFRDVISINYDSTKIDELIPLSATIHFPEFILSKLSIDFKTCFIGETSTEYFRIMNKSESSSVVQLRLDSNTDSIFEINCKECFIPSKDIDSGDDQCTVMISFTPKKAVDYCSKVFVIGMMGEEVVSLPICGKGSYDNQYQRKY